MKTTINGRTVGLRKGETPYTLNALQILHAYKVLTGAKMPGDMPFADAFRFINETYGKPAVLAAAGDGKPDNPLYF